MSLYCRFISGRLPLFVGGDLGLRLTRLVRGHLQRCGPCHAAYQSFRRSYVALHRVGDAHEPEAVASEFWPELKKRLRGDRRPLARVLGAPRFSAVRRVSVAAGVLVSFGAGFLIGDPALLLALRRGSPAGGGSPSERPQALVLPGDEFRAPVNHVTPRNVGSYYLRQTEIVPPKKKKSGIPAERRSPVVPVGTSGGEDDFR